MSVSLTISAATVTPNSFLANSLHDVGPQVNWTGGFGANGASNSQNYLSPVVASGSVSPYCKYRVYGSAIRVRFSSTATVPYQVMVLPSAISSLSGTPGNAFREQPLICVQESVANNSFKPTELICQANVARLLGMKSEDDIRCNDNCSAFHGANPVNLTYFHVLVWSADQTSNIAGQLIVDIDYDCEFFLRNPITSSSV
jgi:hypothetical protein